VGVQPRPASGRMHAAVGRPTRRQRLLLCVCLSGSTSQEDHEFPWADGMLPIDTRAACCMLPADEWGQRCNQTVGAPQWRSCIDLDVHTEPVPRLPPALPVPQEQLTAHLLHTSTSFFTDGIFGGCLRMQSGPFAVKMADALIGAMPEADAAAWFLKWEAALSNALNVTTLNPNGTGLPWISRTRQLIGYGFQDGEYMSGDVLYSSVLYWNATGILSDLYERLGGPPHAAQVAQLRAQAAHVKAQITKELWNQTKGAFVAATELESDRISIWGNALAGASGLATPQQAASIYALFRDREADIFYEGQVRQTPAPHFWDSTHTVSTAHCMKTTCFLLFCPFWLTYMSMCTLVYCTYALSAGAARLSRWGVLGHATAPRAHVHWAVQPDLCLPDLARRYRVLPQPRV
jgi:hypothetical protein